jgi:DNA repair exonuclease SbcCD ATPase subunit
MERQQLEQYIYLKQEQKDLEEKIKKIEKQLDKLNEEGLVVDKVRGGEGNMQSFRIEGFPERDYIKKRTLLIANLQKMEKAEYKALNLLNEIEDYISTVDDSLVRQIIRFRVIDGYSWCEVAKKIKGNTEDSLKKAYYRHFEK